LYKESQCCVEKKSVSFLNKLVLSQKIGDLSNYLEICYGDLVISYEKQDYSKIESDLFLIEKILDVLDKNTLVKENNCDNYIIFFELLRCQSNEILSHSMSIISILIGISYENFIFFNNHNIISFICHNLILRKEAIVETFFCFGTLIKYLRHVDGIESYESILDIISSLFRVDNSYGDQLSLLIYEFLIVYNCPEVFEPVFNILNEMFPSLSGFGRLFLVKSLYNHQECYIMPSFRVLFGHVFAEAMANITDESSLEWIDISFHIISHIYGKDNSYIIELLSTVSINQIERIFFHSNSIESFEIISIGVQLNLELFIQFFLSNENPIYLIIDEAKNGTYNGILKSLNLLLSISMIPSELIINTLVKVDFPKLFEDRFDTPQFSKIICEILKFLIKNSQMLDLKTISMNFDIWEEFICREFIVQPL